MWFSEPSENQVDTTRRLKRLRRRVNKKTTEENKKVEDQKKQRWSKWSKTVKPLWSRRAHRALFRHKSLVFRCFLMFPDVSILSTLPRCPRLLFQLFAFPSFLPFKLLPYFHFTPGAFIPFIQSPVDPHITMSYGLSRSHASLLSSWAAKFRTVIAVPATLELAASPLFPFFPTRPSNAILVVDPTQIDDRLCRLAIVHRPTNNPRGWSSGVHRARIRQTFRRVEGQWHSDHTHRRLVKSRRNCDKMKP